MERNLPGFHLKAVILKPVPSILDLWALLFLSVPRSWVRWWVRSKVGTTISMVLCPLQRGLLALPFSTGLQGFIHEDSMGAGAGAVGMCLARGEGTGPGWMNRTWGWDLLLQLTPVGSDRRVLGHQHSNIGVI